MYKYKVGDKVRIVDSWNFETNENPDGGMDMYLGTIMTVVSVGEFGSCRMAEDCGRWMWNRHCIAETISLDFVANSDRDLEEFLLIE